MLKKDKGICIRTTDYSESSQILSFFTAQNGKLSLIAKGTKRAKSLFSGPIELCTAGDMVFSLKEGEKLGTLTEFNPTFLGFVLRKKLFALNCALFACELLNLFTKELDPHPAMFDEAIIFLQRLENNPDSKILPFLILFQFALLSETGSKPLYDCCANCKKKFADNWQHFFFSSSANGLVCRDCESAFIDKKKISGQCAKCLNQPEKISSCDYKVLVEIQNLLIEYETHILERPLRTSPMILKLIKALK
ncbi:MAG: DNA repair protein RecO [Sedimentisphaerales bacterium]